MSKPLSPQWYYMRNGKEVGPVEASQLRSLAAAGQLSPADLVWREGMADRVSAGKVRGLFALPSPVSCVDSQSLPTEPAIELEQLLFNDGDLVSPWAIGLFQPPPKMFSNLPASLRQGSYPLLKSGEQHGGITGFCFSDRATAFDAYREIVGGMGHDCTVIFQLGDLARLFFMRREMPPGSSIPPIESTDVVFMRGSTVAHVRMTSCLPEEALFLAGKIDSRLLAGT